MNSSDVTIIGAGLVGLSTAYKLKKAYPDADVRVIEKEDRVASHQSGRNSGVMHSGIYYRPGTSRAHHCTEGRGQLEAFCREYGIPFNRCGKIIVAEREQQLYRLHELSDRASRNGLQGVSVLDRGEMKEVEPYAEGAGAVHVPVTGVVDFRQVAMKLRELLTDMGCDIQLGQELVDVEKNGDILHLETESHRFQTRFLVNCAGLYSDRVAYRCGLQPDVKVVPFRGEYYGLTEDAQHLVRALIYPLPDPAFPVLGVHFTRTIDGRVECGPNAVLAFKREGYAPFSFGTADTAESLFYPGFWLMAMKHWKRGMEEYWRSFSKPAFVQEIQKLIPEIRHHHLERPSAGVRALALDFWGNVLDDFVLRTHENQVHVLNAPSPAATASLSIADELVSRLESRF